MVALLLDVQKIHEILGGALWSVSKLETNFSEQKIDVKIQLLRSWSRKSQGEKSIRHWHRHHFVMFFSFDFVVRSWRQYADTQCGIAKSLARTSSRHMTKTRKTKYNHANAYGKEMNEHILQNDTAKAPDKRHHVGDKWRNMQADPAAKPSASKPAKNPCGRQM